MTLVIRSRFLNRAILVSVMARGLKFNVGVKTYPIVRESSEVIRFVQLGNLDGLKRIIASRQATPNDSGEDGWTLLHVKILIFDSVKVVSLISPSQVATFQGRGDIVHFLLGQKADTGVEDIRWRYSSLS